MFFRNKEAARLDKVDEGGWIAMHRACCEGKLSAIQKLYAAGARLDCEDDSGRQPLFVACGFGQLKLVQWLLSKGAPIDATNIEGDTALHNTCGFGHQDLAKHLLSAGANVNAKNKAGWSPLMMACAKGYLRTAEVLHEGGAEIHARNQNGEQALHVASDMGHGKVVKWLLGLGAKIDCTNDEGWQPMHFACAAGNVEVAQLLLKHGARIQARTGDEWSCAHCACAYGHLKVLLWLHDSALAMDLADKFGWQPVHYACANGHLHLLTHPQSPLLTFLEATDNNGARPFHHAASFGHQNVCAFLVEQSAQVTATDKMGAQPLHYAAASGQLEVVQWLTKSGIFSEALDSSGNKPIHLARANQHKEVVDFLLAYRGKASDREEEPDGHDMSRPFDSEVAAHEDSGESGLARLADSGSGVIEGHLAGSSSKNVVLLDNQMSSSSIADATERIAMEKLLAERSSKRGYLYKRGGAARLWRKRWFVIEDGVMSYYANRTQADANQSALGRLNLANCSVRRPTTDHGKGKFGARCMRLDLDLEEQQAFQMAHGMSGLAASFHLDGVVPGLSSSMSKGDVDKDDSEAKGKYLLAAESLQSVEEWMAAMDFWSRKKGNHIRRSLIAAHIMQDMESQKTNETFDDDFDDDDDDEAAGSCASSSTKLNSVSVSSEGDNLPSELVELSRHWSAVALRHQLRTPPASMSDAELEGKSQWQLAKLYYEHLATRGKATDEQVRRCLVFGGGKQDPELQARLWISAVLGEVLPATSMQQLLRSGELLCDLANKLQPDIVSKITRSEILESLPEDRRNARMRANIAQYTEACNELGMPRHLLFTAQDLGDPKGWEKVLKQIIELANMAGRLSDFHGPVMGKVVPKVRSTPPKDKGKMLWKIVADKQLGSSAADSAGKTAVSPPRSKGKLLWKIAADTQLGSDEGKKAQAPAEPGKPTRKGSAFFRKNGIDDGQDLESAKTAVPTVGLVNLDEQFHDWQKFQTNRL